MNEQNIELKMCLEYFQKTEDEYSFDKWVENCDFQFSLVLAEGFEERSLGILEKLSKAHAPLERIIVGRYSSESEYNKKYRKRFEELAASLTPKRWDIVNNNNDGLWVRESINTLNSEPMSSRNLSFILNDAENIAHLTLAAMDSGVKP